MKKSKKSNIRLVAVIILSSILFLKCTSDENDNPKLSVKEIHADSVAPVAIYDTNLPRKYLDSLNAVKDFNKMPHFLNDSCIDANAIYWKDLHHPTSMRKFIIENTTNVKLLKHIVKNALYTNKCNSNSPNTSIPYYNMSFYDMAKEKVEAKF